jgi:hypothetical protein
LDNLHVVVELLTLTLLAVRAFLVGAQVLLVFLGQFLFDVFHHPVLPPPQIIERLAGAVDVIVMLGLRKARHRLDVVVGPFGVVG